MTHHPCPQIRRHVAGSLAAAALLAAAGAQAAPMAAPLPDPIPAATARKVVERTIALVDTEAVYPRDRHEYDAAKAQVLATVDGAADQVDRHALFERIMALLRTLDADGHSFIVAPRVERQRRDTYTVARTSAGKPSFAVVATAYGQVLHWTPPQSYGDIATEAPLLLARLASDHAATPHAAAACALVVDLTAQHGGNAWPPLIAMQPLFGSGNTAAWVARDGARTPIVNPEQLRQMAAAHRKQLDNPLRRFAGAPLAVVVGRQTSSAGEMLLVALLGEGARTRTFGHASQGFTTANRSHVLADGSTLVLTTMRYALGDAAPIKGGIPAQQAAAADAPADAIVLQAAQWAAQAAPACAPPVQPAS